jgi:F0F1-type ATP synthase assembly protein I
MGSRADDEEAASTAPANASGSRRRSLLLGSATSLQANLRGAGPAVAASYTLIGAILLLGGLGYAADAWFDTGPWLLLLGLLLGLVVGFYELARLVWRRR